MYVANLKDGKFKAIETYKDPLTGKTRRATVIIPKNTRATRAAAEQTLKEKIAKAIAESGIDKKNVTFGELVEAYITGSQGIRKASTVARNATELKTWIRIIGKDTLVENLPKLDLLRGLDLLGESPDTKNERLKRFKACIHWAYQHGKIESAEWLNRLHPYKAPPHKTKISEKYLEISEYRQLVQDTQDKPMWCLLIQFMVLTGMRFGEAAALHREDVDLDNKVIHITKSFDSQSQIETDTKNLSSYRDIHIQPQLADVIRQINNLTRVLQMQSKTASVYFLRTFDGSPVQYFAFNKYLKEHTDRICGRKLTTHALRHTAASVMFASGFGEAEVARRLGHENSIITKRIYIHYTEELLAADAKKLDSFII